MPIRVACPSCDAAITAPDESAGETMRCPECGKKLLIPDKRAARDADDDRPRRRSRRDEDDEPDQEDRPRKKKKKAGSKLGLWIALGGVAALLLFAACGGGAWFLFFRKDPTVGADGWARFEHKEGVFTAAFPGGRPEYGSVGSKPPNLNLPGGKNIKDMILKIEAWTREEKGREYAVVLVTVPADPIPGQVEGSMNDTFMSGAKSVEVKPVQANGWTGERRVLRTASQTLVAHVYPLAGKYMLKIAVKGDAKLDPDDPRVAEFFERTKPNPAPK